MSQICVIILTRNEERHLSNAIASVQQIASRIIVVDSESTDGTLEIAQTHGVEILKHPFMNYATQFNWAVDQIGDDSDWLLRLDADEIVTPELALEIRDRLNVLPSEIAGVELPRRMAFMGRPIRWGGVFPTHVIRLFRAGRGHCEQRWMDEHIIVNGGVARFQHELLDDNRHSLSRWTGKHNRYANREVVDMLLRSFGNNDARDETPANGAGAKRWIKENVYAHLPIGFRAFLYFLYRYVFRLGFLDGLEGTAFHVLQGFWYRYLVDLKLVETKRYMANQDVPLEKAIQDVLEIDVSIPERHSPSHSQPSSDG